MDSRTVEVKVPKLYLVKNNTDPTEIGNAPEFSDSQSIARRGGVK